MIQRIQSVYLFIAALLMGAFFLLPFAELVSSSGIFELKSYGAVNETSGAKVLDNYPMLALNLLIAVVSVATIFLYKTRKRQIRICKLNLLLHAGLITIMFLFLDRAADKTSTPPDSIHYKFGLVFPLVSVILVFLALRGIKKDDELVRSADRIR